MAEIPNKTSLKLRIISPQKVLFENEVWAVSSTNSAGNFDILPQHANFITMIKNAPIKVIQLNKQTLSFNFPLAIIYTFNSQVNVYTNISYEETLKQNLPFS